MKQQTEEQAKVLIALKAAERWRAGELKEEGDRAELAAVFLEAIDVLFSALSEKKQREFAPPTPQKRGAKRKVNYRFVGYCLNLAEVQGKKWRAAVDQTRAQCEAEGLAWPPNDIDDTSLRRIKKRYLRSGKPFLARGKIPR